MKVYISVDMEGICGTTSWDEVTKGNPDYEAARKQMTAETVAACEGAKKAGATEIIVRDAHDSAQNIIAGELPEDVTLVRGWSRHPYCMMQELDRTFDASLMVGYHTFAGGEGNPLSHTMNSVNNSSVIINGKFASEFLINYYTSLLEKVPVVFVSGDQELCYHAREYAPEITAVAVKSGTGDSTVNLHPKQALNSIEEGVQKALSDLPAADKLPGHFDVTLNYNNHKDAYKASFFPGASLSEPRSVLFRSKDYFEVLRFFLFTF
jgi:D-amino peptidase